MKNNVWPCTYFYPLSSPHYFLEPDSQNFAVLQMLLTMVNKYYDENGEQPKLIGGLP